MEGQALPIEVRVALPVGSPVPGHGLPSSVRTLDRHRANIPCSAHIREQDKLEVRTAINGESNTSSRCARHSSELNGHNPSAVNGDLLPRRLGHVEMHEGRITPTAIVAGKSVIRWAEICRCDCYRFWPGQTPLWILAYITLYLEACPTSGPTVKQSGAQSCSFSAIASAV